MESLIGDFDHVYHAIALILFIMGRLGTGLSVLISYGPKSLVVPQRVR